MTSKETIHGHHDVSLPDPMKDWVEGLTHNGEYASSSDYVRDLIRRDRERRGQSLTMDELRQIVADARRIIAARKEAR